MSDEHRDDKDNEVDIPLNEVDKHQDDIDTFLQTPDPDTCEPWTKTSNEYLLELKHAASNHMQEHSDSCDYFTALDYYWRIPAIVVPSAGGPIVLLMQYMETNYACDAERPSEYASAIFLLLASMLCIVNEVFQFEKRKQEHNRFEAEYQTIVHEIEAELVKHKKYRNNVEVVISSIQLKLNNLKLREPEIPAHKRI